MTVSTHWVTGLGWTLSLIVGAALSPTDPAAVFSVLHGRSGGSLRVATVLEGEAGFNDPVAIALVIALVDAAHHGHDPAVGEIAWTMLREGVVGAIVGIGLALLLARLLSPRAPTIGVAPALVVSLGAFLAFGVAGVAHGSGFLAAYLFGLVLGDRLQAARETVGRLQEQLSSLAEVGMFVLLGVALMTIPLRGSLAEALAIAALLVLVIRPLVAGPVLAVSGLGRAGTIFGVWGGLKGAVPILLGSLPIASGLAGGEPALRARRARRGVLAARAGADARASRAAARDLGSRGRPEEQPLLRARRVLDVGRAGPDVGVVQVELALGLRGGCERSLRGARSGRRVRRRGLRVAAEAEVREQPHELAEVDVRDARVTADHEHVLVVRGRRRLGEVGRARDHDGVVAERVDQHDLRVDVLHVAC